MNNYSFKMWPKGLSLCLVCVIALSGCGNSSKDAEPEWVTKLNEISQYMQGDTLIDVYFKYNQLVNGYEVTGRWRPFNKDCETGPVLMNFHNQETGFEFQYFFPFYRSYDTDGVTYGKEFKGHKQGDIHYFNYTSPETLDCLKERNGNSPLGYYSPFQFLDIDFDGKDEFIVSDWYIGEGGNNYAVYAILDNGLKRIDYIPLDRLSCVDRIDLKERTITIVCFDGTCDIAEFYFSCKNRKDKITEIPRFYTGCANRFDFEKYNDELGCPFVLDSIKEDLNKVEGHHAIYEINGNKIIRVRGEKQGTIRHGRW